MCKSDGRHPLYDIWGTMKQRCYNKNNKSYKNYGYRDIKICDEWKNDFKKFYNWSIKNGYKKNLEIDRKNNNGNYEPTNCRWVNRTIQSRNKRNNKIIQAFGEEKCVVDWSKDSRCTVHLMTLFQRLNKGIQPELAITKEARRKFTNSEKEFIINSYKNMSSKELGIKIGVSSKMITEFLYRSKLTRRNK